MKARPGGGLHQMRPLPARPKPQPSFLHRLLKNKNLVPVLVGLLSVCLAAFVVNRYGASVMSMFEGAEDDYYEGMSGGNRKRADVQALGLELAYELPKLVTSPFTPSSFFPAEHISELLWGTYRPQVYAGMRMREAQDSLLTGLMWYQPDSSPMRIHLRHVTKSEDSIRFEWVKHDGRSFGIQHINDTKMGLEMNVSFVKYKNDFGGDWVMRVTGYPSPSAPPSLDTVCIMYYVGLQNQKSGKIRLENVQPNQHVPVLGSTVISGQTPSTGSFSMVLHDNVKKNKKGTYYSGVRLHEEWQVEQNLRIILPKGARRAQLENVVHSDANVYVTQRFKKLPFEFEVVFVSNSKSRFESNAKLTEYVQELVDGFGVDLKKKCDEFDARFENTFKLKELGSSNELIEMGKVALSNMLGGIGYFHGHNRIIRPQQAERLPGEPNWGYTGKAYSLLTATPSRSYFPRGFLWDEGFHQLLISQFDKELSKDMLLHWLHLAHEDGWIPREQILGHEAETRVPEEFIAQTPDHANPPTLFFPLESILSHGELTDSDRLFLERAFAQLSNNYLWYLRSQQGKAKNTFRWRGASGLHTLASGLDDYPRAVNRSELEEHVDLHCWMAHAAHQLDRFATALERFELHHFKTIAEELSSTLQERYWSPLDKAYSDWDGLNKQHVGHHGYVNLFPLLFGLIPVDSPRLSDTLHLIENDTMLKSPYGLRSLSRSDPLFGTHENYWRGPIWININYLTLRALHRYYLTDGPYQERAQAAYTSLRRSIINNVFRVYKKQGAMFENYNALNGGGQGQHPFAGWTSLVLLIMAESY